MAGLGDLNEDGYDDFIVSAPTLNYFNYPDYGGAWVFYGSESGPASNPDWQAVGERQYSLFGSSVAGAGDVNGDGYLDVIIGARGYDSEFVADIGAAYIYYGSESGLATTPGWKVVSDQAYSGFGISVAGLGDVNQDGYADVAVGAPKYSAGESKEGAVFEFWNTASGTASSMNIFCSSSSFSGFCCARSWAWLKSSFTLYSSQISSVRGRLGCASQGALCMVPANQPS